MCGLVGFCSSHLFHIRLFLWPSNVHLSFGYGELNYVGSTISKQYVYSQLCDAVKTNSDIFQLDDQQRLLCTAPIVPFESIRVRTEFDGIAEDPARKIRFCFNVFSTFSCVLLFVLGFVQPRTSYNNFNHCLIVQQFMYSGQHGFNECSWISIGSTQLLKPNRQSNGLLVVAVVFNSPFQQCNVPHVQLICDVDDNVVSKKK